MSGTELRLPSYAKVNLTLDVLGKRPEDGYHYIRSVMVPVTLADDVHLSPQDDVSLTSQPAIPCPLEENLAYRAAQALREASGVTSGVRIHIQKKIPVAGGLAGGSSNAAAVLQGLNRLWGLNWPEEQLRRIGGKLGADVPFCLFQRPALVEGIGERLLPITVTRPFWAVVAYPPVAKSTGNVYRWLDELAEYPRPDTDRMLRALATGELEEVALALGNVFEAVMLPRHPKIKELKELMLAKGALGAVMSGAGPSVLGLVANRESGEQIVQHLTTTAASMAAFVVQLRLPGEG